jgi:DNA-binding IscR family transcriptional regulator
MEGVLSEAQASFEKSLAKITLADLAKHIKEKNR